MVPFSMVHEVYAQAACEQKRLITIPNAMHGMAWARDRVQEHKIADAADEYIKNYMHTGTTV